MSTQQATTGSFFFPWSMKNGDIPDTGRPWMSLNPRMQFQPSTEIESNSALWSYMDRMLKGSSSGYEKQFIDGAETYYDDYSQAWRLLGFYIDCNAPANNNKECNTGQGSNYYNNQNSDSPPCQRYLLWAAYIDLNYSGGGIGEYQFYDRKTKRWDSSSCKAKNSRCAKMDCHLKDTSFTLLGLFKEPNYHEWMEQLFKHAGVCIWTDEENSYMQTDRHLWPCDCINTGQFDEQGNELYYETKPRPEGRIGLGLYTDRRCSEDYLGKISIETVLENYVSSVGEESEYGTVYSLDKSLSKWNDAFDAFKLCQPCKAYDLGFNADLSKGREGGGEDENGQAFDCVDDAGYTNVNQCMKFRTETEMFPADFRDVTIAHQQGTIVQVEVFGVTYGFGGYPRLSASLDTKFSTTRMATTTKTSFGFFVASIFVFFVGAGCFIMARKRFDGLKKRLLKVPLVPSKGEMS